jgi:hypothetical protein
VETENFRLRELRKALTVLDVRIVVAVLRSVVNAGRRELMVVVLNLLAEVFTHEHHQSSAIKFLSYTSTVVTFTDEVTQSSKRHIFRVLINEDRQLLDRDTQVSLIETVLDIPAKGTVQTALLNNGMEETETEEELAEFLGS